MKKRRGTGLTARQLRYFVAVAEFGGVTRAAASLHLAQPSLSDAIRTLERTLGAELFERTSQGMVPTAAGHALLGPARQVLAGLDDAAGAVAATAALESGRLDVAVPSGLAMDPFSAMAAKFRGHHPGVWLNITGPLPGNSVTRLVQQGVCELGLIVLPVETHANLLCAPVGTVDLLLVLPPGSRRTEAPVRLDEVERIPIIAPSRYTHRRRLIDQHFAAHDVELRVEVVSSHEGNFTALVRAGAGAAFLPASWARVAERAGLVVRPLDPPLRHDVGLIRRDGPLSPAATAFCEQLDALDDFIDA